MKLRIIFSIFVLLLAVIHANGKIGFPFPGPGATASGGGPPPIGTPTAIGSRNIATAPPASFTITTSAAVSSGNFLICYIAWGTNGTPSLSTVSDGTNSYSLANKIVIAGTVQSEIWYKANATAVGSGATITFTMTAAGSGGNEGTIATCYQVANMNTSAPFDVGSTSGTNTTTPSVSTGTLAQANSIVFGGSYNNNQAAPVYSESTGTGFTNLTSRTGTVGQSYGFGYRIVSATTSVTYSPTWSATAVIGLVTQVAAFKGL